eukprot:scaffold651682_cov59-Attheya_sp.AAC.1
MGLPDSQWAMPVCRGRPLEKFNLPITSFQLSIKLSMKWPNSGTAVATNGTAGVSHYELPVEPWVTVAITIPKVPKPISRTHQVSQSSCPVDPAPPRDFCSVLFEARIRSSFWSQ